MQDLEVIFCWRKENNINECEPFEVNLFIPMSSINSFAKGIK